MHFDLIDLRLYLHILDTGNITAGAARSHYSAPLSCWNPVKCGSGLAREEASPVTREPPPCTLT